MVCNCKAVDSIIDASDCIKLSTPPVPRSMDSLFSNGLALFAESLRLLSKINPLSDPLVVAAILNMLLN